VLALALTEQVEGKQKHVKRRSERRNWQEALLLLDSTHNTNQTKKFSELGRKIGRVSEA
jgi:hypothetical protein